MKFHSPVNFPGQRASQALGIANMNGAVGMHYREIGEEKIQQMQAGDICHAENSDEHVAHPRGPALILVVKREGSE